MVKGSESRSSGGKRKLILFDVDQTLVEVSPYHEMAFEKVMKDVYGIEGRMSEIRYAGKTEAECFREVGELHGLDRKVVDEKMQIVYKEYAKNFKNFIRKDKNVEGNVEGKVLLGVKKLLQSLSKTDNMIGIVTGNSREIAEIILKKSKLQKYFTIIATSDQAKTRKELVKIAIAEAKKKFDVEFHGKNIIIIGDSVHDIECGKPYGALTIAVCTGMYTADELKQHNPDYIFKNLSDYKKILKVIEK
jgi:HAD superfamily hydrolase (TIGR01549 family)